MLDDGNNSTLATGNHENPAATISSGWPQLGPPTGLSDNQISGSSTSDKALMSTGGESLAPPNMSTPLSTIPLSSPVSSSTSAAGSASPSIDIPAPNPVITSRAGRPVKPSQYAEQMNRIGSAMGSLPSGKENMPQSDINVEPEWFKAVKQYLEKQEFDGDWAGCVAAWLLLEGNLYKKVSKHLNFLSLMHN